QLGGARLPLGAGALFAGDIDVVVELVLVSMASLQVERLVDRDPVDPAEELVARVVVRGSLGDLEEDRLADVVRIFMFAQNPERRVVDGPLIADHQGGERLAVAAQVALDQEPVIVLLRSTRDGDGSWRAHQRPGSISRIWSNPE